MESVANLVKKKMSPKESDALIQKILELHSPKMRMIPDGEVETCDSCSQIATMECIEYVHLIEYPCPTVTLIFKALK